ncbi:MAG TPA: metal-dependent hydrolase [Bacteroidetes bacterium]|nr:metal-dependent hydrolase [Bacteroidota bacterium]
MKKLSLRVGERKLYYYLEFKDRKTLGFSVYPNLNVLIKAPLNTELDLIKKKVKSKLLWILKQQNFFLSFEPKSPPKKFINGESHLYLGKEYKLKIIKSKKDFIKKIDNQIIVFHSGKNEVQKIIKHWYYSNARIKFYNLAMPYVKKFRKYNVEPEAIDVRWMKFRWGSCTPSNKIILNPELMKAPVGCIEYVIVHELCHLVIKNHNANFFKLQNKEMPDWEKWKERLEKLLA